MAGELELNSKSGLEQTRNLERFLIHPGMNHNTIEHKSSFIAINELVVSFLNNRKGKTLLIYLDNIVIDCDFNTKKTNL